MTSPEAVLLGQKRSTSVSVRRATGYLAAAVLAYLAVAFFLRDPLHYIIDQSEASFGRYWPRRPWLLLHIAGGTLALFMGPFQLWSGLRRNHLAIHRWTGRFYILGILLGGASAFYMSFFTAPPDFAVALFALAAAWWLTVGMAFVAIKRRRIDAHRQWMIRGYGITFAFVTFRWLVDLPLWEPLGNARFAAVGWVSWVAPLLIAEVLLQWRHTIGLRRVSPRA